ncbi:MAG: UDP-N-acetylmuramate dehydrogenase [Acetoanaerobium sp.]|uniref:UDP-N-acetylenolpyruvoylglucosamine reductase n=1 Tax=Acetoanaerobium sticklandii (strain ATCC 12662 / DSM 519 / JCM 1433 / CCUG 9281 / NCIMB 10654 / HF) TaxID=499177 RepID=E3PSC5_ACESD|nr:UDP-N-acetylmuramate dehydrogenase [Acetoanaerobium sticklandii]MBP8763418.1 UDP-N-acetylmuramate dehydrogenase [Acetoanaerobium sp.]CBH21779.1 UDP-N-acetylenolpyruvoylglucosamine reductase 2 (UDP-N-acetylmuramate dehydrogenase 2) [Acetoanaerobium sticklandii]
MRETYDILKNIVSEQDILTKEYMKNHTSFKIGGSADFLVTPRTVDQIQNLIKTLKKENIPVFIMGNGSNLLVSDKGIRGVVIKLSKNFSSFSISGDEVTAQSGILLSTLSKSIVNESLSGFEFASGIPGTIGGAVTMNAGAYDSEMKNIVEEVVAMDMDGNIKTFTNQEMNFRYRKSRVTDETLVVLEAKLKLEKGNIEDIKAKIDDFTVRRTTKQPLTAYSAGSTFKRPEGYFAGKLIEDAGLKGIIMRNAAVSSLHSGFVINTGDATCENILELIEFIKLTVFSKFGVMLEEEVRVVGEQ